MRENVRETMPVGQQSSPEISTSASTGMPAAVALTDAELKDGIVEFVRGASIGIPPDDALVTELPAHLPPGTAVCIAHPLGRPLQDVVRGAVHIQSRGLPACPHIVARALTSERQLRTALADLRDAGIARILLVGGDQNVPAGPFGSALDVLDTGATLDYGIKTVGVSGHPEGTQAIGPTLLWEALRAKQVFAARTGTHVHVVTQFGFNPQAIFDWQRHCQKRDIALPVHVGLAGHTRLAPLIRYSMKCGIGASLHALMRSASALPGLARVTITPEEMLVGLVRGRRAFGDAAIVKPHFFCFRGGVETARWLHRVIDGAFELNEDGSRFTVRPD